MLSEVQICIIYHFPFGDLFLIYLGFLWGQVGNNNVVTDVLAWSKLVLYYLY